MPISKHKIRHHARLRTKKHAAVTIPKTDAAGVRIISTYNFNSGDIPIEIKVYTKSGEFVPIYDVSISGISKNTEIVLQKVVDELTSQVSIGMVDILDTKDTGVIEKKFMQAIEILLNKHFPDADEKTINYLKSYLAQKSLGLGSIEILMDDINLEEVAVNSAEDPVWVYHKKYGWLKTNVRISDEARVRHYSTIIGRDVGKEITLLQPLMDASLLTGDRVKATLSPISSKGNTITIRKFLDRPWTVTDFIKSGTFSYEVAALLWLAVQYELSVLISGGTGSGKTSALNVLCSFFPPNQRIISIEDTREIQLPSFLHWIPMVTRLPNPEGKGEVSMLDLLVNSLRMRPDRILVGEIRRKREAEVLFEAIHTGHSVYATVHANDAEETIARLTNPPIDIPRTLLPAISMIVVQFRNRRTGVRKTFQIAEIMPDASPRVLMQLDIKSGQLQKANESIRLIETLQTFTGLTKQEIDADLKEKQGILRYLVDENINTVDDVGKVMAQYYSDKDGLFKEMSARKGKGG